MLTEILINLKVTFRVDKESLPIIEPGQIKTLTGERKGDFISMQRNILEYLENSAKCHAEKTAVTDGKISYRYRELEELSMRIGSALAGRVNIGEPIAVLTEKNADAVGIFLGIVQAGAFYSFLNPELPQKRLEQIQSVLHANYLITDEEHLKLAERLTDQNHILMIKELKKVPINKEKLQLIRSKMIDTDPLYANFTSGSTGVPKGVVVSHRSAIDFIDQFSELFSITDSDVIGNQAPFDFDVSVKDIYTALKSGAALLVIPRSFFSQPKLLLDFICEYKVTTMIWAVSALCLITAFHGLDYRTPTTVKRVLFSGEVMPLKHLNIWMEKLPEAEFVNLYGPTEITCNCTYHRIVRGRDYTKGIPIGKAFPNEEVFLLDENGIVTEEGKLGEICVRGTALALGYFRNSEQTEKVFVENPLNKWYPERIYRTGDLGTYTKDGEILFKGRKDFQIKYMGHRIELEEIEQAVSKIKGVERCCAIFDEEKQRLYGFYIGSIEKKELHSQLTGLLPRYMIPGVLEQLEAFPLTKNGKTDRRLLLERKKR